MNRGPSPRASLRALFALTLAAAVTVARPTPASAQAVDTPLPATSIVATPVATPLATPVAAPVAAVADRGFDPARDARNSRVAVWLQPFWMAGLGPLLGRYNVTGGVSIALRRNIDLVIEGAYEFGRYCSGVLSGGGFGNYCHGRDRGYVLASVSVGVAFQLTGRRNFDGWFVQPKLVLAGYGGNPLNAVSPSYDVGASMAAAVDFGYQLSRGPFYIALVAGIGAGFGPGGDRTPVHGDCEGSTSGLCVAFIANYVGPVRGFLYGYNAAAVRMGVAF